MLGDYPELKAKGNSSSGKFLKTTVGLQLQPAALVGVYCANEPTKTRADKTNRATIMYGNNSYPRPRARHLPVYEIDGKHFSDYLAAAANCIPRAMRTLLSCRVQK